MDKLEGFIKKRTTTQTTSSYVWADDLDRYRTHVNMLYTQISTWLQPLIDKELVKLELIKTHVTESEIGTYEIEQLQLYLADKKVIFDPIGTNLIAAFGRIDVNGENGSATLLLVRKELQRPNVKVYISADGNMPVVPEPPVETEPIELDWKIVVRTTYQYISVTEESFQDLLLEVMGDEQ